MEDAVPTILATGNHKSRLETGSRTVPRKEVAHLNNINNRTEAHVPEILFNIPQILFNSF